MIEGGYEIKRFGVMLDDLNGVIVLLDECSDGKTPWFVMTVGPGETEQLGLCMEFKRIDVSR